MRIVKKLVIVLAALVLIVSGIVPVSSADEVKSWTGWIIDRDCVGANVLNHAKSCNLMDSCYTSGLGIIVYKQGKAPGSYNLDDYLVFDGASRELARNFLNTLPSGWVKNITVAVKGYEVSDIPVNKDESDVPETDASKVDHSIKGIHVTSIEAAFIDGVSTNAITSKASPATTPTPVPSLTPSSTPTPVPSSTAVPATPTPTATPTPSASATPATTNATATPTPSATPAPSATPLPTPIITATPSPTVKLYDVDVNFDGKLLTFDVPPRIENGRTLVPLRKIFEALGATVGWDDKTKTVTAVKDSITFKLTIGEKKYYVNNTEFELDVPGKIYNERTLVPARVVAESFKAKVDWDDKTKTVIIKSVY